MARLTLERQLQAQGPRWRRLDNGKQGFIDVLKSFAGQSVTVVECGTAGNKDNEAWMLEQYLLDSLGKDEGAGWTTEYKSWDRCGGYAGSQINVSTASSDSVKEAARVLRDALIRLNIAADMFPVFPEYRSVLVSIQGVTSPGVMALNDPKAIFILIGSNPMVTTPGSSKSRNRK